MSVDIAVSDMRQFGGKRVHPLVISSDLDALLEHDERTRRTWSSSDPGLPSPPPPPPIGQSLPPPPRRARVPPSPLSPLAPRSPLVVQQPPEPRAPTPGSADSNPYINPAPLFLDSPKPITPPPRTSSMGIETGMGEGSTSSGGIDGSSNGDRLQQSSESPSHPSSPADRCFPSPPPRTSFLPLRNKKSGSKDAQIVHKRSRGKLVKQRTESTESVAISQRSSSQHSSSSSPQMSSPSEAQGRRRQRSRPRSSISVSSGQGSFIDLESPQSPFIAAPPSQSSLPKATKPPVPTTPKPDFRRRPTVLRTAPAPVGPPSVPVRALHPDAMPPTTNFLNPAERAQLIKKSRKLAQVFGQTPGAADFHPDASPSLSFLDVASPTNSSRAKQKGSGHRPAASMNMIGQMPPAQRPQPPWQLPEKTVHLTASGRRHSTPNTPVSDEGHAPPGSEDDAHSFMDFNSHSHSSEDQAQEIEVHPDDSVSLADTTGSQSPTLERRGRGRGRAVLPNSPSSPSLFSISDLSPEEQAELEKRRRRDKLAKLHRFLGSRVPASLVLPPGTVPDPLPLPPLVVALDGTLALDDGASPTSTGSPSRPWMKKRRSSSAVALGGRNAWSDATDRVKEELGDKEKAIIVRRAQKMEKVFGVAPPQKLYNSGSGSPNAGTSNTPSPSPVERNQNQSPYKRKTSSQGKQHQRPGTADSAQFLLAHAQPSAGAGTSAAAGSFVYTHYQHSLNSLHDILDRDDRASLAELHQYLNDGASAYWDPDAEGDAEGDTPLEFAPTRPKGVRRRSLPARTSISSLSSKASFASIASVLTTDTVLTVGPSEGASAANTPDGTKEFQTRRRRAAKLTQFFGVDYRDLIEDVLESIELGLDAERRRGTLNTEQAEDLLQKLRTIKTRRA